MSLLDTASLLLTPNAYKEGKLYSVIPSDGSGDFTFTRATTATRVNSDGLVELVPYNLLQRSEEFDNAYWVKTNTTITANVITSPNGTLTADRLVENTAASSVHYVRTGSITFGSPTTASIYMKSDGRDWVYVQLSGSGSTAFFNLSSGVVGTVTDCTATITNVGDGWYRCSIADITVSSAFVIFGLASADGVTSYTGDGVSGIYLWGAQLVEGTNALPYQKTETRLNIPRLDYSLGGCPSLLVEPQRTNLITWSEDYSSTWGSGFTSITKNLLSPAGITNGSTIVNNVGSNRSIFKVISVVSGNTYRWTFYIKKISGSYVNNTAIQLSSWGPAVASQTYTNLGTTLTTDWVRYTHTFTATSTNTVYIQLISNEINTFGLYGAQLEVGSYATSYIQTTTASVTRNADSAGISNGSFLPTAYPFTIYSEGIFKEETAYLFSFLNNAASNVYFASYYSSNKIIAIARNVSTQTATSTNDFSLNTLYKVAVVFTSSNIDLYVNGNLEASVPHSVVFTLAVNDLLLGQFRIFSDNGTRTPIKSLAIWNTSLTDDECIQLTTI